eukprot:CAMPEP_0167755836 /NCGR_PEP_ID=MMETSP0110_2-20121227/9044_1 /TAXON_ID=629695 /ORGANISM="Gymnochlora sp., Strain CCMP2014" /LENGTH=245 /DNA_ID=CAMNT_0007641865 /DNA_START=25 /DNA_END=758 /DNA_ORIENTATION=+
MTMFSDDLSGFNRFGVKNYGGGRAKVMIGPRLNYRCRAGLGDIFKNAGEILSGKKDFSQDAFSKIDPEELKELGVEEVEKNMREGNLNFDDFLKQMKIMDKMSGLASLAEKVPGIGGKIDTSKIQEANERLARYEAMVLPMTPEERKKPELFVPSAKGAMTRIRRVSEESGKPVQEVQAFIGEFFMMKEVMTRVANGEDMGKVQADVKKQAMAMAQGKFPTKKQPSMKKKLKNKAKGKAGGGFGG